MKILRNNTVILAITRIRNLFTKLVNHSRIVLDMTELHQVARPLSADWRF